jgi:hypothetical protein
MPYGGDEFDHEAIRESGRPPYLFDPNDGRRHLVYAGALLPRAFEALDRILRSMADNREQFQNTTFHFVGTGKSPDDSHGYNVRGLAERYGLWGDIIVEHPPRIPYLDVLSHLHAADGIFILGSTESHYTPSKVFQGVLAEKPVFAVLHEASTACAVLRQTGAGHVLAIRGESDVDTLQHSFPVAFAEFCNFSAGFDPLLVDRSRFEPYTARSSAQMLAQAMDEALARQVHGRRLVELTGGSDA